MVPYSTFGSHFIVCMEKIWPKSGVWAHKKLDSKNFSTVRTLALQIQSSQCQANDSFDRFDWTCWKWTNNGTAQEEEARPVVRKPMLTSPLSNAKTKLTASFRNLGSPIHSPQCQTVNLMTQGASQSAYWLVYFEGYVFHSATLKNTIRKLFQIDFVDNDFTSKSM